MGIAKSSLFIMLAMLSDIDEMPPWAKSSAFLMAMLLVGWIITVRDVKERQKDRDAQRLDRDEMSRITNRALDMLGRKIKRGHDDDDEHGNQN